MTDLLLRCSPCCCATSTCYVYVRRDADVHTAAIAKMQHAAFLHAALMNEVSNLQLRSKDISKLLVTNKGPGRGKKTTFQASIKLQPNGY